MLALQHEHPTETQIERTDEKQPGHVAAISVHGLARFVEAARSMPTGVSGPDRKGAEPFIASRVVERQLSRDTKDWVGHEEVVHFAVTNINKLVQRGHVDGDTNRSHLMSELAQKIDVLASAAEFPGTKAGRNGLARLVMSMPTEQAKYYLSDDFIAELQESVEDVPELDYEVGEYFSIKQLLRGAITNRRPDEIVRTAVQKAAEVLRDKDAYLQRVTGKDETDQLFVSTLTPRALLVAATASPRNADESIARSAERFAELCQDYPLVAHHDPKIITELLIKNGLNVDMERTRKQLGGSEEVLAQAQKHGNMSSGVRYLATRSNTPRSYEDVVARANFLTQDAIANDEWDSTLKQRLNASFDRGRLQPGDFIAMEQGKEYREILLEIDEATDENSEELVREVLDAVRNIHTVSREFCERLPQRSAAEIQMTLGLENSFDKRITELLSLLPPLLKGEDRSAKIYHGDTPYKEVTMKSPQELRDVVKLTELFLSTFGQDAGHSYTETTIRPVEGMGRFVRDDGKTAIATRLDEGTTGEQRLSWTMYVSPDEQMRVLGQIVQSKNARVTIHLDLERSGHLSLDFGGSLEFVEREQPLNFMLAAATTIGATEYTRRTDARENLNGYHVRETFARDLADPDAFRRWCSAAMYGLKIDHSSSH